MLSLSNRSTFSKLSLAGLLFVFLAIVALSATKSEANTQARAEAPAAPMPVVITVLTSRSASEVLTGIQAEFEADYPEVRLNVLAVEALDTDTSMAGFADSTADIIQQGSAVTDLEIAYRAERIDTVKPLLSWLNSERGRAVLSTLNVAQLKVTLKN